MKKLLTNALQNAITTIAGSVAGIGTIKEGIVEQDATKIIIGIGLFILGIFAKE
jgi:hypothetical protein